MDWRRVGAGVAAAGALGTGGTVAVEANINPYEVSAEKYELASQSIIEAAGENKVEAHRDRPAVTLSKWDGEAAMTVAYRAINAEGTRQFLTDRIEWKADREEVHAYPLPAGEGMEDGGFEIEVVLDEAPDSNVFEFAIEDADELDFFYQPELTPEEIAEGAFRPENVVGSYAVYHKTKANHRVGDTNYATGKAYHIYRPKAFAADGAETWAELEYADDVLTVTVPEEWLAKAAYPVRVDPTFGFTTLGGTSTFWSNGFIEGSFFSAPETGSISMISASRNTQSSNSTRAALYEKSTGNLIAYSNITDFTAVGAPRFVDITVDQGTISITAQEYWIVITDGNGVNALADSEANKGINHNPSYDNSSGAPPSTVPTSPTLQNFKFSIYATYTASGGGGDATGAPQDVIWFD